MQLCKHDVWSFRKSRWDTKNPAILENWLEVCGDTSHEGGSRQLENRPSWNITTVVWLWSESLSVERWMLSHSGGSLELEIVVQLQVHFSLSTRTEQYWIALHRSLIFVKDPLRTGRSSCLLLWDVKAQSVWVSLSEHSTPVAIRGIGKRHMT